MKARLSAIITALGIAVTGSVALPAPAAADASCTITGFQPRTVVVGLTPPSPTFAITTSGCAQVSAWGLETSTFFVYESARKETFDPVDNAEAGPQDVRVTAANGDFAEQERVFPDGFSLKRRTTWQSRSFNASPEPVRPGRSITIKARLLVADWSNNRYVGYGARSISVQFRTPTGTYATVKTVTTRADGWLSTTVPATQNGIWRVVYGGNAVAAGALVVGDSVEVR